MHLRKPFRQKKTMYATTLDVYVNVSMTFTMSCQNTYINHMVYANIVTHHLYLESVHKY